MERKVKKISNASSSATSNTSSSLEIKSTRPYHRNEDKVASSRSRSFLYCLGKQFGRRFFHHHSHQARLGVYSSTDDLRTSSTDSFSLALERSYRFDHHLTASNIDLTTAERQESSRSSTSTSAYSRFSPGFCPYDGDDYEEYMSSVNRPYSVMGTTQPQEIQALSIDDDEEEDDDDDNDDEVREVDHDADSENEDDDDDENALGAVNDHLSAKKRKALDAVSSIIKTTKSNLTNSNSGSNSSSTDCSDRNHSARSCMGQAKKNGLHLSRMSITSSVSRLFQHFSISGGHNDTVGRSLSATNTPLKATPKNGKPTDKKPKTNKKSKLSLLAALPSVLPPPKKEKKQQSILRPPVPYVYTKGMSGLYSRVPRYQSCCPYAMQQCA